MELDSFDTVEGLRIASGPFVEVFNGISLHSNLVVSEPVCDAVKTDDVLRFLQAHWKTHGAPGYAQFDNAPIFLGSPKAKEISGRVLRFCLSVGVIPVFAPPYEFGFQAKIEAYNGQWQEKVWSRFRHADIEDLRCRSRAYVLERMIRSRKRIAEAPARRPFPDAPLVTSNAAQSGKVIYIRRLTERGSVKILNTIFVVSPEWANRLCRCEYDIDKSLFSFYQLRRKAPEHQLLLSQQKYVPPR